MGILNVKADQVGLVGVAPKYIYIDTRDTIAEITAVGYLNAAPRTFGVALATTDMALVSSKESPAVPVTVAMYNVAKAGDDWSLVPYPAPAP
jgi:hypothetical protein